jgi:hypothetical protein
MKKSACVVTLIIATVHSVFTQSKCLESETTIECN